MAKGKVGFHKKRILGKKASSKNGKLAKPKPLAQPPKCPECGSAKTWKDGLRYPRSKGQSIQRHLCRNCGHRFTQRNIQVNVSGKINEGSHTSKKHRNPSVLGGDFSTNQLLNESPLMLSEDVGSHSASVVEKRLNSFCFYNSNCRVCVSEAEGTKNLVKVESRTEKWAAGASTQAEVKGKIVEHSFWLLKQGYSPATIKMRTRQLKRLMERGANLFDPESVKETIAKQSWSVNGKICYVTAYATFALWMNIPFEPPHYKRVEKLSWVPTEYDIDQLIVACSEKMATYLQLLKETGMRPGEAYYLKWTSIDPIRKIVRVTPEKNSKPRI